MTAILTGTQSGEFMHDRSVVFRRAGLSNLHINKQPQQPLTLITNQRRWESSAKWRWDRGVGTTGGKRESDLSTDCVPLLCHNLDEFPNQSKTMVVRGPVTVARAPVALVTQYAAYSLCCLAPCCIVTAMSLRPCPSVTAGRRHNRHRVARRRFQLSQP